MDLPCTHLSPASITWNLLLSIQNGTLIATDHITQTMSWNNTSYSDFAMLNKQTYYAVGKKLEARNHIITIKDTVNKGTCILSRTVKINTYKYQGHLKGGYKKFPCTVGHPTCHHQSLSPKFEHQFQPVSSTDHIVFIYSLWIIWIIFPITLPHIHMHMHTHKQENYTNIVICG